MKFDEKLDENIKLKTELSSDAREPENQLTVASSPLPLPLPLPPSVAEMFEAILPDRYEFLGVLGQGAMGAVLKVREKNIGTVFALKTLTPQLLEDRSAIALFDNEARAASGLTHPNIGSIFEFGTAQNGAPYMVMEFINGQNLEAILKETPRLSIPRTLDLCIQVADALSYAHGEGIVHRDVKPSNIMVIKGDQGVELVKLVDFGIAKTVQNSSGNETQSGDVVGSPYYMSPEQCSGEAVGPQSDIYSLGCVMYECLVGKPPFDGINPVETILQHLRTDPLSPAECLGRDTVPVALSDIVMNCLKKTTKDRYSSAALLQADLETFRDNRQAKLKFDPTAHVRAEKAAVWKQAVASITRREVSETLKFDIAFALVVCIISFLVVTANAPRTTEPERAAMSALWGLERGLKKDGEHANAAGISRFIARFGNEDHKGSAEWELARQLRDAGDYKRAYRVYKDSFDSEGDPNDLDAAFVNEYIDVLKHLNRSAEAAKIKSQMK